MKFDEYLDEHGTAIELVAGEHLFWQGDLDRQVYLLERGLLKVYYLSEDGKETVKSFISSGESIGSLTSAHQGAPCPFNVQALEPSSLTGLDFPELLEASKKHPEIADTLIDLLLRFALKKERREREFLTLSAEERYRSLLEQNPGLQNRVLQKDIARYLGITPVALSRIRSRF